MSDKFDKINQQFLQLVLSLQAGAMQQMGKVVSQITGKLERDLMMAKTTIDILEMIDQKTKGNLTEEENKLLSHILYELRMNYVDESKKTDTAGKKEDAEPETRVDDDNKEKE